MPKAPRPKVRPYRPVAGLAEAQTVVEVSHPVGSCLVSLFADPRTGTLRVDVYRMSETVDVDAQYPEWCENATARATRDALLSIEPGRTGVVRGRMVARSRDGTRFTHALCTSASQPLREATEALTLPPPRPASPAAAAPPNPAG